MTANQHHKYLDDLTSNIDDFLPGISIDCVILAYREKKIKVLLLNWLNTSLWALPGSFVRIDQDLDIEAREILKMRTGLSDVSLHQFYTFGKVGRRHKKHRQLLNANEFKNHPEMRQWLDNRFITIAYLALVVANKIKPRPDALTRTIEWFSIDDLPPLVFDHSDIIERSLLHIRRELNYLPISISMLPKKFTMSELQILYELILGRKLDRGNFQKKIRKLDVLNRHEKQQTNQAGKSAFLYSFKKDRYHELCNAGISFI